MKDTVWNSATKDVILFEKEAEAAVYVKENNYMVNGRYVLRLTTADICSACGGGLDTSGWCANYCMSD